MNETLHNTKNLTLPRQAADSCQVLPLCPALTQCHLHLTENFTAGLVSKHKARKILPCQLLNSFLADCRCAGIFCSALNSIKPEIQHEPN